MKQEEKILDEAVVCYLVKRDSDNHITHVWLGLKTRKIGAGCRDGYGGGIEKGETEIEAVVREVFEESGIRVQGLEKAATVYCHNRLENGGAFMCPVHIYLTDDYDGVPEERPDENMVDPRLYTIDEVPIDKLMLANKDWLPHVLNGKKLVARAYYNPFQKSLYKPTEIEFVDEFREFISD